MQVEASMRLRDPGATEICEEAAIYEACLALAGAEVLELGCGRAEHTRAIARAYPTARITALEVDPVQHAINRAAAAPPNLRFGTGGAQAIPAGDRSVDIVLMFKSLHHVPVQSLDAALREIHRVLRRGGLAYVSEPVFAGELNEIIRIFHDEEQVRIHAFAALRRAVASGLFELAGERFFLAPGFFRDFAEFERTVIKATHSNHRLDERQYAAVRERFQRHVGPDGARFDSPLRVDLLRKPALE